MQAFAPYPDGTRLHPERPVIWVIVADGHQAKAYFYHKTKKTVPIIGNIKRHRYQEKEEDCLVAITDREWKAELPEDYQLGNRLLGRVFESATTARHASEPRVDIREELKFRFMRKVAHDLQAACQDQCFDRLIIIAPPKLLAELKRHLDKKTLNAILAELPKELTHYKNCDLVAWVRDII